MLDYEGKLYNHAVASAGWHPLTMKVMDMAGNETTLHGFIEVTRRNLVYLELVGNANQQNQAPGNSTGMVVYVPVASTTSQAQPTPEANFGGETNALPVTCFSFCVQPK